eukprot:5538-Chlamydomonas_euryale.AAC.2
MECLGRECVCRVLGRPGIALGLGPGLPTRALCNGCDLAVEDVDVVSGKDSGQWGARGGALMGCVASWQDAAANGFIAEP